MRALKTWPIFLLTFSFRVRLILTTVTFICCLGIFLFVFPSTHNGTSIVIPIIFSAWLFRFRGLVLSIIATAIALTCIYSLMLQTIFWPRPFLLLALTGFLTGVFVGLVVSSLRYTVDVVEDARRHAQDAEEQRVLALAQRLEAIHEQERLLLENEQQRQLNALKDQVLANVSHELRTPLTSISGYLELLQVAQKQGNLSSQEIFLSRAIDGCGELTNLINTMLDALRVNAQVPLPNQETLALAPLVHDAIASIDPRTLQEYALHIQIAEQLHVWADKQFVRQILSNLLSNAFKYAPPHTPILIRADLDVKEKISYKEQSISRVCVSVKDAGLGIPPAELPLLFQKFSRLKRDLSGNIRGTGLGLYISKQLVEAMHGDIWAESSGLPGEGASFHFTLPIVDTTSSSSLTVIDSALLTR